MTGHRHNWRGSGTVCPSLAYRSNSGLTVRIFGSPMQAARTHAPRHDAQSDGFASDLYDPTSVLTA